ncbi:MAG: protein kinase [Deltaproteobacteria bacterium]
MVRTDRSWIAKPGEVIGGYALEQLLAMGSTAHVFLARHALLGRPAAVKVLSPELVSNSTVVARLLTEARIVNDIRHPNIVDIFDFVSSDEPRRVALVMELVEGPSLMQLRGRAFRFEHAIAIAIQLVEATAAAHRAGVIHRDLKPGNLLLTKHPDVCEDTPTLKLVDFGIAKLAQASGRTATGMMLGTPAYMAPEQIMRRPEPSFATDVYAIGEVLYELLAGRRVFPANKIHETVRAKLRGHVPDLALPAGTPEREAILEMVQACLARAPQDRPTLDAVRALLVRVLPSGWAPRSEGAKVVADSLPKVPAYIEERTKPIALHPDIDVTDQGPPSPPPPDPAVLCADLDIDPAIDETRTGEHGGIYPLALAAPTELELVIDVTKTDDVAPPDLGTLVTPPLPDDCPDFRSLDAVTDAGLDAPPIPARRSLGSATVADADLLAAVTEAIVYPPPPNVCDEPETIAPTGAVLPTMPLQIRLEPDDAAVTRRPSSPRASVETRAPSRPQSAAPTRRSAPWHVVSARPDPTPRPLLPTSVMSMPDDRTWTLPVAVSLIFFAAVFVLGVALHGAV